MQVMLMRLMSKGEYLIVPKGTKFKGSGKFGLNDIIFSTFIQCSAAYSTKDIISRGITVHVIFLLTVLCSLYISLVYFYI